MFKKLGMMKDTLRDILFKWAIEWGNSADLPKCAFCSAQSNQKVNFASKYMYVCCVPNRILPLVYLDAAPLLCSTLISTWVVFYQTAHHCFALSGNDCLLFFYYFLFKGELQADHKDSEADHLSHIKKKKNSLNAWLKCATIAGRMSASMLTPLWDVKSPIWRLLRVWSLNFWLFWAYAASLRTSQSERTFALNISKCLGQTYTSWNTSLQAESTAGLLQV